KAAQRVRRPIITSPPPTSSITPAATSTGSRVACSGGIGTGQPKSFWPPWEQKRSPVTMRSSAWVYGPSGVMNAGIDPPCGAGRASSGRAYRARRDAPRLARRSVAAAAQEAAPEAVLRRRLPSDAHVALAPRLRRAAVGAHVDVDAARPARRHAVEHEVLAPEP